VQQVGKAQVTSGVAPAQSEVRFLRLPDLRSQICDGIDPVKSLLSKLASTKSLAFPNPLGMDPLNLLFEKSAYSKSGLFPQLVLSMGPENLFSETSRKLSTLLSLRVGSVPSKSTLFNATTSENEICGKGS